MKNIEIFINEAIRRGRKKHNPLIDPKHFDTILENLRKDDENYIGVIGELTDDIVIDSVENDAVWGHLDSPVNKMFEREDPKEIELFDKDKVIVIYDKMDKDDNNDNRIKNLYICKYEDIWYYLYSHDANEFMEYVKILKKDEPK